MPILVSLHIYMEIGAKLNNKIWLAFAFQFTPAVFFFSFKFRCLICHDWHRSISYVLVMEIGSIFLQYFLTSCFVMDAVPIYL